jgi:hypothetical protein
MAMRIHPIREQKLGLSGNMVVRLMKANTWRSQFFIDFRGGTCRETLFVGGTHSHGGRPDDILPTVISRLFLGFFRGSSHIKGLRR